MNRTLTGAGLVLAGAALSLAASGCKPGSSTDAKASTGASAAKASASAFATSPAVQHDEVIALRKLAGCVSTGTHGELTFKVTTTTKGQADIPGTTTPSPATVTVTHWNVALLHHLIRKADATVACAVPPGQKASVEACVKHLSLPTSKAKISPYFIAVSGCVVGDPQ
jgi:hypothetical protein